MYSEEFVEQGAAEFDPYAYYPSQSEYELHTGDPRQDLEYERQYQQSTYIVPEVIKNFLVYFQKCVHEQNLFEIQNAYENGFNKLTDRFFKNSAWPEAEIIAPVVGDDPVFLILYRELYYRHIYARVATGPTQEQRFESYYNYCNLFNYILSAESPVPLELPNQWLWDIIDEFIYQFQSFSQYRCKLGKKSEDEVEHLRRNPKIWNVHSVLNVLHSLVDKSNINRQLEVYTSGGDPDSVAGEFGRHSLYKMLGYFSLIGLLRLHSLLGDYYQALKVLENIDFNKKNMYSRVPACQITTYYYVGFAYMMMRRYQDSIRTFSNILLYIQRTKQMFQNKAQLYDQINKQNEQMYTLLAICLVLHPMRIDESVHTQLREKFGDRMLKMQKGDVLEFQNSFSFACPKFLSPCPPNYDATPANFHKEPFMQQLKVFMDEVTQQALLPTIRSYLKLYTTLTLSKLAAFMETSEEDLRNHLMCFKHKMKNVVWTGSCSGLEGEFQSASEVDFYIDQDMIHIADTKVARRYGDFFIRQIHKFEEVMKTLKP
ncbi:eukaryotic translation initiation factor 3 subunit L-like [Lingula anatina]|uniref:Eukaryotic translation initiation factor 3 subunit L n=2 Tax=Lingula anatina TaxID=7574 RepID=A0A1S3J4M9_LINAN|nr:eukaryotic translation initiation factor 3 subunit L isoform X1 [Lingula anatina]XP_023929976.1 eukaryotic translation initiation factor 3 subunit L isoform X2 [Lingula anatina]XP_023930881.1 eukaryotic translation initiation factor 3 subunit L-like [Lingula anatina]|eukprot:XP_023929975.1 eukaryotic translation initiation factor 3 subunit L isoform X1 [Lingula anatina]